MNRQLSTMSLSDLFRKFLSPLIMIDGETNLWHRRLRIAIIILLITGVSLVSTDSSPNPQIAQGYGEFNIPLFAKEMLEKEGIPVEDLKNDRELRREWLKKVWDMRGKKEGSHKRKQTETSLEKRSHTSHENGRKRKGKGKAPQNDYYEVIVTDNLFRPLGYRRKPKSDSPFELLATVVYREPGKSKALIRSNKDQKVYYVGIGEEFAGAKVEKIESLKVTLLYDGRLKRFRASKGSFLNGGGGGRRGGNKEEVKGSGGENFKGNFNFEMNRKIIKMKKQMIDASPEGRKKLLRQIKEMLRRREGD